MFIFNIQEWHCDSCQMREILDRCSNIKTEGEVNFNAKWKMAYIKFTSRSYFN